MIPLVVYWQTTAFHFVWDDMGLHLNSNIHLIELSFQNLFFFWQKPYQGLYIPVTYNLWLLLKPIGQIFSNNPSLPFNPFIYHLANVLLHIINGLLVFALLSLIEKKNRWAVFGGTLLFLIHPLQVEVVAWVSEMRGLLSTTLGLSALHLYLHVFNLKQPSRRQFNGYYSISLLLFSLAFLSKPSAIIFPLLTILFCYLVNKQFFLQATIKLLPLCAVIIPIIWVTKSDQYITMVYPSWLSPLIWMDAINFYLYKLVFPVSLAASYGRTPQYVLDQWWVYIEWILPIILVFVVWRFRHKYPLLLIAFTIFIVGFLPVSGLVSFTFQEWSTVADRYLYISMLGVALAFTSGLTYLNKPAHLILSSLFFLTLGLWTYYVQVPVWENSYTLWNHCLHITQNDPKAYNNRGYAFQIMGKYNLAIKDYGTALEFDSLNAGTFTNRAHAYQMLDNITLAFKDYNKALELNPRYVEAYNNRGLLFFQTGNTDEAMLDYSKAIEIDPNYADAYFNRGNAFRESEEYEKAIEDFTRVIEIDPLNFKALNNRGVVFGLLSNYRRAIDDFTATIKLNPYYTEAYNNLGHALWKIRDYDHALNNFNQALKLRKNYPDALFNRGRVYIELAEYENAIKDFNEAIKKDNHLTSAYYLRALSHFFIGNYHEAWTDVCKVKELGGEVNSDFEDELAKSINSEESRQPGSEH